MTDIIALVTVAASIIAVIIAWQKAPHETENIRADTADKIGEIALALVEPLQKRIEELEASRERQRASISQLEQRITDLECELREERTNRAEIEAGAQRLVHQVESLGANPVYRPPKRGTGELKAKP